MVLRVSVIRAPVPSTACTKAAVRVATPQSRPTRFSATRSADSTAQASPVIRASVAPGATASPSAATASKVAEGSSAAKARRAQPRPAATPALRAAIRPEKRVPVSMQARLVTSPARPRSSARAARTIGSTIRSGRGSTPAYSAAKRRPRSASTRARVVKVRRAGEAISGKSER